MLPPFGGALHDIPKSGPVKETDYPSPFRKLNMLVDALKNTREFCRGRQMVKT